MPKGLSQRLQATAGSVLVWSNRGVEFKAPPHVVSRSVQGEVWLAEFMDPDGNQLALMSEVANSNA